MPVSGSSKRQETYFLAFSEDFKQQSAVDVPLANSDLDILLPLVEPTRPQKEQSRETIYDCDGVHIRQTFINSELMRWNFSIQPSARMFAGFMALAKGAASAFSGTGANEVQTLSTTATGGTFTLSLAFEGRTGTTVPIAYNASTATIKAALEGMQRPISAGDIATVTGNWSTGIIITFGGKLANTALPLMTVDNTLATGGTVTIAETTPGASETSDITRATGAQLPLVSFIIGYEGDTASYKKYYNQVVNSVTLNINKGQLSQIDIEMIGSTRYFSEPTFVVPQCINYDPIRAVDTRFLIDSNFVTADTRSVTYTLNNNVATDQDAFPFDSVFMSVFERGYRQTETLEFAIDGCETDDVYVWADALTDKPVKIYFGAPVNRAIVDIPVCELSLGSPDVAYTPGGRTFLNIVGEPHKDATLGTYSKVEYLEDNGTAFLAT
jgi:hypothetical protein